MVAAHQLPRLRLVFQVGQLRRRLFPRSARRVIPGRVRRVRRARGGRLRRRGRRPYRLRYGPGSSMAIPDVILPRVTRRRDPPVSVFRVDLAVLGLDDHAPPQQVRHVALTPPAHAGVLGFSDDPHGSRRRGRRGRKEGNPLESGRKTGRTRREPAELTGKCKNWKKDALFPCVYRIRGEDPSRVSSTLMCTAQKKTPRRGCQGADEVVEPDGAHCKAGSSSRQVPASTRRAAPNHSLPRRASPNRTPPANPSPSAPCLAPPGQSYPYLPRHFHLLDLPFRQTPQHRRMPHRCPVQDARRTCRRPLPVGTDRPRPRVLAHRTQSRRLQRHGAPAPVAGCTGARRRFADAAGGHPCPLILICSSAHAAGH